MRLTTRSGLSWRNLQSRVLSSAVMAGLQRWTETFSFLFQPGDGRFSGVREELKEEHVLLSLQKPSDRMRERLVTVPEDLKLPEHCDRPEQDGNWTWNFWDLHKIGWKADLELPGTDEGGLSQNHRSTASEEEVVESSLGTACKPN